MERVNVVRSIVFLGSASYHRMHRTELAPFIAYCNSIPDAYPLLVLFQLILPYHFVSSMHVTRMTETAKCVEESTTSQVYFLVV